MNNFLNELKEKFLNEMTNINYDKDEPFEWIFQLEIIDYYFKKVREEKKNWKIYWNKLFSCNIGKDHFLNFILISSQNYFLNDLNDEEKNIFINSLFITLLEKVFYLLKQFFHNFNRNYLIKIFYFNVLLYLQLKKVLLILYIKFLKVICKENVLLNFFQKIKMNGGYG